MAGPAAIVQTKLILAGVVGCIASSSRRAFDAVDWSGCMTTDSRTAERHIIPPRAQ
jgi:hypothetical protein